MAVCATDAALVRHSLSVSVRLVRRRTVFSQNVIKSLVLCIFKITTGISLLKVAVSFSVTCNKGR